jgi:putative flippase GtrA
MEIPGASLLQRQGIRQFIKFCIVGLSSTVIDTGILWVLTKKMMVFTKLPWIPWWSWTALTFCLAVTNGFVWNRRWTFRALGHASTKEQYTKFFATNAVGLVLNQVFMKLFLIFFTGQMVHTTNPDPDQLLIAKICAIPCVVLWNFAAAKYWTFRAPDARRDYGSSGGQEPI